MIPTLKKIGVRLLVLTLFFSTLWVPVSGRSGAVSADDNDWVQNPANGHFYRLTDWTAWSDAEAQAVEWGGHLVTINDPEEEFWLIEQFYPSDLRIGFWIGLNDIEVEGNMVWSSGETPGYENWCPGEPNDLYGEDAVNMEGYPYDNPDGYCWNDNPDFIHRRGIVEKSLMEVPVDIKPGSYPNSVNPYAGGVVPVAILGSVDFDVTQIDRYTLRFGSLEVNSRGNGILQCSLTDVSGDFSTWPTGAPDGYDDLVCQFALDPTLWVPENGTASVTGNLLNGTSFIGSDSIRIVPP